MIRSSNLLERDFADRSSSHSGSLSLSSFARRKIANQVCLMCPSIYVPNQINQLRSALGGV